jgi:cupin 2 domain-containing protein
MVHGELTSEIPAELPDELVSVLATGGGVRIERIVSRGHRSPQGFWYDQDEHEFVLLVAGEARIEIEGQAARELRPGQWLVLPAHLRHRVAFTAEDRDTIWLAVFFAR